MQGDNFSTEQRKNTEKKNARERADYISSTVYAYRMKIDQQVSSCYLRSMTSGQYIVILRIVEENGSMRNLQGGSLIRHKM